MLQLKHFRGTCYESGAQVYCQADWSVQNKFGEQKSKHIKQGTNNDCTLQLSLEM